MGVCECVRMVCEFTWECASVCIYACRSVCVFNAFTIQRIMRMCEYANVYVCTSFTVRRTYAVHCTYTYTTCIVSTCNIISVRLTQVVCITLIYFRW